MAASILPGIINVATAYKNKPKQYNASDYENKNFGRAFDEMSRPELLDISAELSNNRSSAYEMYQNMASVANGQNAGFIAKNLSKVHRAKFNADAQTYQKKQNFDAAIKNEFKAKRSQMLLDDGKSNAANRYQVDRDNEAEKAGNLQMKMEGFSQIGKGVADSLKNWTKSNNDSEVLGRLKEILSAKKGGVVGHKFISGGVSSKINPNKLIEVQKGEVMYNPNNESIVTAKQLAKTKGIPERTHNQKGYDPAQRKDVTGIQIPTPERGTIIYGNMKNPISGNKFQDDAQKLAKLYANYAKKLADPKSDALERRTARLNAQNSIKNFKELANIQETLRSLKSPKKGK
jgi:hypothetical protein